MEYLTANTHEIYVLGVSHSNNKLYGEIKGKMSLWISSRQSIPTDEGVTIEGTE